MMTRAGDRGVAPDSQVLAESLASPERFALIVDSYSDAIHGYLARRVGPAVAEDLAAETFLRAFRSRDTYRQVHTTALPWLYGIATNLLRDYASAERQRLDALANLKAQAVFGAPGEDVDRAAEAALSFQNLGAALATLSAPARDVVVLVAVEGLTYDEAAVALQVPVGTVRSRLARPDRPPVCPRRARENGAGCAPPKFNSRRGVLMIDELELVRQLFDADPARGCPGPVRERVMAEVSRAAPLPPATRNGAHRSHRRPRPSSRADSSKPVPYPRYSAPRVPNRPGVGRGGEQSWPRLASQ